MIGDLIIPQVTPGAVEVHVNLIPISRRTRRQLFVIYLISCLDGD